MAELGGLLVYCKEKEEQKIKLPIWFAQIVISKLTGEEPIRYADMFSAKQTSQVKEQSAEEILAEFKAIVDEDIRKRGPKL